jgi:hypothetical protein
MQIVKKTNKTNIFKFNISKIIFFNNSKFIKVLNIFISAIFYVIFINLFTIYSTYSNTSDSTNQNNRINHFNYGFDKFLNTFLFFGNANLDIVTDFGQFMVNQAYTGVGLTGVNNSFREDESFNFNYKKSLTDNLFVKVKQNWLLSSDSRNIGLNNLQRLNGILLISYNENNQYFAEIGTGAEKNEQIGVTATGGVFQINAFAREVELDDFVLNSKLNTERIKLGEDRKFNVLDFETNVISFSDNNNSFDINFKYRNLERDLLSQFVNVENGRLIENRIEDRIGASMGLSFPISDKIYNNLIFNLERQTVDKKFNDFLGTNTLTGVKRKLNEDIINLNYSLVMNYENFKQNFSIFLLNRNEKNITSKEFDLLDTDLNILRNQENQRDNISFQTRINSSSFYNLTSTDTVSFNFAASLLRYDTPSEQNNDERDELNQNLSISYGKKYNDNFNFNLKFEYLYNHLVFLKASRSALNNENKILKLTPSVRFKNEYISFKPEFDLTANYTIYDFEEITSGIRSFSFRQLAYRDSINIKLNHKYQIDFSIFYRYFERGVFFNKSFAELPQNSNLEQLFKLMFVVGNREINQFKTILTLNNSQVGSFNEMNNNYNNLSNYESQNNSIINPDSTKNKQIDYYSQFDNTNDYNVKSNLVYGFGLRYFKLEQNNLQQLSANFNLPNFTQRSIAPETFIIYYFDDENSVSFNGWYEFRYIKDSLSQIPNLFLKTNIFL